MGFTNVQVLEGGVQAWIEAGLPVAQNGAHQDPSNIQQEEKQKVSDAEAQRLCTGIRRAAQ
jgi:3-mercaptopyruvate sulfurtransferase SseA